MSMFFKYKGRLKFESEARAADYYELLTNTTDSWYSFVPEDIELAGNVIEFKSDRIEQLQNEIAHELGYDIVHHRLELYGRKRQIG